MLKTEDHIGLQQVGETSNHESDHDQDSGGAEIGEDLPQMWCIHSSEALEKEQ
jgi:hypothetical protein